MGLDLLKGDKGFRYGSYSYVWVVRFRLCRSLIKDPTCFTEQELNDVAKDFFARNMTMCGYVTSPGVYELCHKFDTTGALYRFITHSDCDGITSAKDAKILSKMFKSGFNDIEEYARSIPDIEEGKDFKLWVREFIDFVDNNKGKIYYV